MNSLGRTVKAICVKGKTGSRRPWLLRAGLAWIALGLGPAVWAQALTGAGSSAAAPIYRSWGAAYQQATGQALVYESVGSSAGLKKIKAHEVGYGASDVAPSAQDAERDGLVVVPIAITGIAPVVNLPRLESGALRLSGKVIVQIFGGRITRWNDPQIAEINPGLSLPALPIRVIVRADGSGTTYNFSHYLSGLDPDWRAAHGVGTTVNWPQDVLTAKGSEGVAHRVAETVGGITYIDFAYVREFHLNPAQVDNREGEWLLPSNDGFRTAMNHSDWVVKGDFTAMLTNQPGHGVWPITMGTFALLPQVTNTPDITSAALRFLTWSFMRGDQLVQQNNFVRLPNRVQAAAFKAMASVHDSQGHPIGFQISGF